MKPYKTSLILLCIGTFVLYNKYTQIKFMSKHLNVRLTGIQNINIYYPYLTFDANFEIKNNSPYAFDGLIADRILVKEVRIFGDDGNYIGNITNNMFPIYLQKYGVTSIPNKSCQINIANAFDEIFSNINQYLQGKLNGLKFQFYLVVFGREIIIKA